MPPTTNSSHDFGHDLIPCIVKNGKAVAHKFSRQLRARRGWRNEPYWRDVGTIDAYWQANIDLTDFVPELDIYDRILADLDLFRDRAAGEVHPRRGGPARRRHLVADRGRHDHLGLGGEELADLHRRAAAFLFVGDLLGAAAACAGEPHRRG